MTDLPCRGRIDFHAHHVAEAGGPDAGGQHHFLGGDAAAAGFHALHRAVLDRDPVTAVRLKAFAPFWRASSARPKHRRMGLSLASPLKLRQAMTLSETCGSWRSSSSRSQKVTSTPSFFCPHSWRARFPCLPLVVDQQAEAFGLELDVAGQLAADFRNMSCPILQNWLK